MKPILASIIGVVATLLLVAINVFVTGFILFLLWNGSVVPAFHLPSLTFLQSVGIYALYLVIKQEKPLLSASVKK